MNRTSKAPTRLHATLSALPLRYTVPGALLLFTAMVAGWGYVRNIRLSEAQVERGAVASLRLEVAALQGSLEYLYSKGAQEQVRQELAEKRADPEIAMSAVTDEHDVIIAAGRNANLGRTLAGSLEDFRARAQGLDLPGTLEAVRTRQVGQVLLSANDLVFGLYPVALGAVPGQLRVARVGTLVLVRDLVVQKTQARQEVARQVAGFALPMAGLAGVLLTLSQLVITRRVTALVQAAQRFASGDTHTRAGLRGWDELAAVGAAFDAMADRVSSANQELAESEARFRVVANSAPVMVWMSDLSRCCTYFNQPWLDFTGRTLVQELGKGWTDGVHPEDLARCQEIYTTSFDTRQPFTIEYRLRRHDGEYRWVVESVVPRFDPSGSFVGDIGSCVDITERKQVEEALRLFRSQVERANDSIEVIDPETGRFLDMNERGCLDLGYTRGQVLQLGVPDIDPNMDLAAFRRVVGDLREVEALRFESVHLRKDGTTFPVEVAFRLVRLNREYVVASVRDLTELKRSAQALRETETHMRLATEATGVGTWDWNVLTNRVRWDAQMFRIYGIAPTKDGVVEYSDWSGSVLPEDLPEQEEVLQDTVRRLGRSAREFRIRRRDDQECRNIEAVETVRANAHGQAEWVVGTNLDITERRQAEEALRQSESHFRTLYDNSPYCIHEIDREGRLMRMNRAGLNMMGVQDERAICGVVYLSAVAGEDKERIGRLQQLAFQGQASEFDFQSTTGLIFQSSFVPITDAQGTVIRLMGLTQDITGRRRAEEALQMMRFSVDRAGDSIFWLSREGRILYVNDAACGSRGYAREELLAMTIFDLDPDYQPGVWGPHFEDLRRCGTITLETRHRTKDGRVFPIEVHANYVHIGGQEFNFCFLRDITTRKQADEARQKLEGELRQAQKMEAIGTLAGGIAHDFNNILGAIMGNVALAQEDVGPGHPAQESLDLIASASERARNLVRQILTFSRRDSRERRLLNLRSTIEEDVRLLRATLPASVELITRFTDDTLSVLGDRTETHQVLLNLCTNAWHAMEGRSGRITLSLEGVTVDDALASVHTELQPGHYGRLTISDTGTGMDAALLERIFDPYFTTKEFGKGTGLGLSVVHGIMKGIQGAITVTSQPGLGTTFELYFPTAAGAGPAGAGPLTPAGASRGRGQHLLFLDDEAPIVTASARMLERLGYRVTGFTRVTEALAALRADPAGFDLVVTDYNMPGTSGLDVARQVRQVRPDLPVMLTSGGITDELRAEAQTAGVRHLLSKPYSMEAIGRTVHRLVHSPA